MFGDFRLKIALLLFLAIPAFGAWQFAKHYFVRPTEHHISSPEFQTLEGKAEAQRVLLYGFIKGTDVPIVTGRYEYMRVDSSVGPEIAILCRRKTLEGSISDRVSTGRVTGYYSTTSREWAEEMGLIGSDFAAERIVFLDVDHEYLSSIACLTLGFTLFGLVYLGYVFLKVDDRNFQVRTQRNRTKSQVALQLAIAKQEIVRY